MVKPIFRVLMAVAVASGALLSAAPAQAAAQEYAPCAKLTAGETKFSGFGANRVIFTTARDYGVNAVLITSCVNNGSGYSQEWQTTGYGGLKGFAPPGKMWEDTWFSPTGSYSVTEALGRSNPGTALQYHTVNPNSRWGGERGPTYNQYFEGAGGESDENLYTYMNQGYYEQAAVINWNRQPDMGVTQGASFAIFFHAGNTTSAGCISTDLGTVTRMLRSATPGDRFIMGTVNDVFSPAVPPPPPVPPAPVAAPAPAVAKPAPVAAPVVPPEAPVEAVAPEPTKTEEPTPTATPTPSVSVEPSASAIPSVATAPPPSEAPEEIQAENVNASTPMNPLVIGGIALCLLGLMAVAFYIVKSRQNVRR